MVVAPAAFIVASGNGREWFEATNPPAASAGQPVASIGGNWILAIGGQETGGVAIWFSANGLDWERAAMIGSAGQPTEVVSVLSAADQVFVTLATLGAHPALVPADVWASFDGTAWRQLDLGGEDFITGAAGSGDTVVLVGGRSFFVNLAGKP